MFKEALPCGCSLTAFVSGFNLVRGFISSGIDMANTMDFNNFTVGVIGMGDMGKMYARRLSDAGWR